MTGDEAKIWLLAANIAVVSLMAIGGGIITVLPELHRQVVDVYGWMTSQEFADLFAMAQAAPGPNLLVVTLIGFHVGGVSGALLATVAISAPTCTLAYFVSRLWFRFRQARWRIKVQAGLIPVTIGLVAASAYVIARSADTSLVAVAITALSFAAIAFTRLHPLIFLGAGGLLGFFGWI